VEQRRDNPACHQSLFLKCKFSTTRDRHRRKRNPGSSPHPPVGGKLIRGFEGLDVGDRVRVELIGTDRAGGLRFVCPGSGIGGGGLFALS